MAGFNISLPEGKHILSNTEYMALLEVEARFTPEGNVIPSAIIWEDGQRYEIEKILDIKRRGSTKAGGSGLRYTVRIQGKERYMFLDGYQWFVERK